MCGKSGTVLDASEPPSLSQVIAVTAVTCIIWHFFEIPSSDVIFSVGYALYLIASDFARFDNNRPSKSAGIPFMMLTFDLDQHGGGGWFAMYIASFAIAGLVLPTIVLIGTYNPDDPKNPAAPHLFVLLAQITMEHLSGYLDCHALIKCLVPIGFSSYRQMTLVEWVRSTYLLWKEDKNLMGHQFAMGLAIANLAMWSYNLFVFLLLRMLPTYVDSNRYPVASVKWKVGNLVPVLTNVEQKVQ